LLPFPSTTTTVPVLKQNPGGYGSLKNILTKEQSKITNVNNNRY
jgi:hypothetical protein